MNRYQVLLPESTVWPPIWAETLLEAKVIAWRLYPMRRELDIRDDPAPFTCPKCGGQLLVCRNVETELRIDPATGNYSAQIDGGALSGVFYSVACSACDSQVRINEGQRITHDLMLELAYASGALARP